MADVLLQAADCLGGGAQAQYRQTDIPPQQPSMRAEPQQQLRAVRAACAESTADAQQEDQRAIQRAELAELLKAQLTPYLQTTQLQLASMQRQMQEQQKAHEQQLKAALEAAHLETDREWREREAEMQAWLREMQAKVAEADPFPPHMPADGDEAEPIDPEMKYSPVDMRRMGVSIQAVDVSSQEKALNSWQAIVSNLDTLNLTAIAEHGLLKGASDTDVRGPQAMRDLRKVLTTFMAGSTEVQTSVRTSLPAGASAFEVFQHIRGNFIKPEELEADEAFTRLTAFEFDRLTRVDARGARTILTEFFSYVALLPDDQRGSSQTWIKFILKKLPSVLLAAFDRERSIAGLTGSATEMSATAFKELLGKSCGAENQRTKSSAKPADRFDGLGRPGLNIHGDGGRGTDTEAVCKDCSSKFCPKSRRTDAQCDVYGTPTEWRVTRVPPFAQGPLNEKRVAAGKPPIVFPAKPSVNAATVDTPPAAVSDADAMRAANAESQAKIDAFMAHGFPGMMAGPSASAHTFSSEADACAAMRGLTCSMCEEDLNSLDSILAMRGNTK